MATCSSILAWEIPWTEELLGVIKSRTQLRGYAHTHIYCKIVITIKFINKPITSHSCCWERPSAACRLSALISLYKNGPWAWNTPLPRDKEPMQPVPVLSPRGGHLSLFWAQRGPPCLCLCGVHHAAPGHPHCVCPLWEDMGFV